MDRCARLWTGAAALAALCGGCGTGTSRAEELGRVRDPATLENGTFFNGTFFNGTFFNGTFFNGTTTGVVLDSLRLDALRLHGRAFSRVSLAGGAIAAVAPGGGQVSGSGLVGAELSGALSDGTAVTLRIDDVVAGDDADVQRYGVSVRVAGSAELRPLCGVAGDGSAVRAIPLLGVWDASAGTPTGGAHVDDPELFTFACEGYVLAKCVAFGYAPWRSVTECKAPGDCEVRSLAPFHQACTRLLRADYCGDGTATTRDGTPVDVWDRFGIQSDDEPAWVFEAEWGADGATCVDATRWATIEGTGADVQAYLRDHCGGRWARAGCGGDGSTFNTPAGFEAPLTARALLRSRIQRSD